MSCEQALELLSGHLDGQNTSEEEQALQAHLQTCAACRALLEAFTAVDRGIESLEAEPPAALLTGVMGRVEADQTGTVRTKKRRFFFGPGTAVAAVAAVLLLVLGTGNLQNLRLGQASIAKPKDTVVTQSEDNQAADQEPDVAAAEPAQADIPAPMAIEADPAQSPQVSAAVAPPQDQKISSAPMPQIRIAEPSNFSVAPTTADVQGPELVITENPEKPALKTIAALQNLIASTDESGATCILSDVKTAREIAAQYAEIYTMELVCVEDAAQDETVCTIYIVQP